MTLRVGPVARHGSRVIAFDLARQDGGELPPFTAGAHVALHLPDGLVRHYSLVNDPAERHRYRVAVSRDAASRGGSAYLHDHLVEGALLEVGEPLNQFALAPSDGHATLIAGGIGVTPMIAMMHALDRRGGAFTLHYVVRSAADAPFADELRARFGERVRIVAHDAARDPALPLATLIPARGQDDHLYCCGPAGLMEAVRAAAAGWPDDRVHFESFMPSADLAKPAGSFAVRLARSGRVLEVGADETILDALLRAGLDIDYSCREGTCGTCITPLLGGVADHRDAVLSPAERAASRDILICCSRALSDELLLDL